MRVLLLEDETAIRSALRRGLERAGHHVAEADSLAAARKQLEDFAPETLITDLKLPDGSGLDIAEEIARPFVVMSGYADFDDAVRALRLGCVDFFTKPVAIHDLLRRIERLEAKASGDGTLLVDPEGSRTLRLAAQAFEISEVAAHSFRWYTPAEARAAFEGRPEAAACDVRERQVMAELMQCSEAGRLVINRCQGRWRAWLEADLAERDLEDCQQLIDRIADHSCWRSNGVVVEVCSAG
jgi:DNA-binding response OmpR family regulator